MFEKLAGKIVGIDTDQIVSEVARGFNQVLEILIDRICAKESIDTVNVVKKRIKLWTYQHEPVKTSIVLDDELIATIEVKLKGSKLEIVVVSHEKHTDKKKT